MTVKGCDVSSYQGETYSTTGLAFVFVKATEGTHYTNPKYAAQVTHGRQAHLVIGHYLFARPGSMSAQADYFAAHAAVQPGDLIAVDWEDPGVSGEAKDALIKALQTRYPHNRVLLYCNRDFWLHRDTTSYCGDGLWIAAPDAPAGHPRVEHPWTVHQYSFAGGIDRNVARFADPGALRAWAAGTTPTPQEDDMQLTDAVTLPAQAKALWPTDKGVADGKVAVNTALGSGYVHARRARENTDVLLGRVDALTRTVAGQTAAIAALAAKVGSGEDTATIVAAVQKAIAAAVVHVTVTTDPAPAGA